MQTHLQLQARPDNVKWICEHACGHRRRDARHSNAHWLAHPTLEVRKIFLDNLGVHGVEHPVEAAVAAVRQQGDGVAAEKAAEALSRHDALSYLNRLAENTEG